MKFIGSLNFCHDLRSGDKAANSWTRLKKCWATLAGTTRNTTMMVRDHVGQG